MQREGGEHRPHQNALVRELHSRVEQDVAKEEVLPVHRLHDGPRDAADKRARLRVVWAPQPVLKERLWHLSGPPVPASA
jgi:hypothetical protein